MAKLPCDLAGDDHWWRCWEEVHVHVPEGRHLLFSRVWVNFALRVRGRRLQLTPAPRRGSRSRWALLARRPGNNFRCLISKYILTGVLLMTLDLVASEDIDFWKSQLSIGLVGVTTVHSWSRARCRVPCREDRSRRRRPCCARRAARSRTEGDDYHFFKIVTFLHCVSTLDVYHLQKIGTISHCVPWSVSLVFIRWDNNVARSSVIGIPRESRLMIDVFAYAVIEWRSFTQ